MDEVIVQWTPRERARYPRETWEKVKPGQGIVCLTENEAAACAQYCQRRGFVMQRESRGDGTYVVGRVK